MSSPPAGRDRDPTGRARNARPRDALGRPLGREAGRQSAPDEPATAAAEALVRAQSLLDAGRPFTAHEVLEAVWKATPDDERELWRGLAQVAVGITHALRGNPTGAARLLSRGANSMTPYAGTAPHRVDVDGIIAWARAAAADLSLVAEPPRLRLPG